MMSYQMSARRSSLLAVITLAGVLGGASIAQAGGTVVWATAFDPDSLDPSKTTTWESFVAFTQVYNSLLYIDRDGKVVPNMAQSWETSPDGLTYTFHLHDGIKCSDNSPLT